VPISCRCETTNLNCKYRKAAQNTFVQTSVHKMLVKLTAIVTVINILQAAFAPIFFCQKITEPKFQKSCAKHFGTKKAHVKCWWNWPQEYDDVLLQSFSRPIFRDLLWRFSTKLCRGHFFFLWYIFHHFLKILLTWRKKELLVWWQKSHNNVKTNVKNLDWV